jgi:hypothetical protein
METVAYAALDRAMRAAVLAVHLDQSVVSRQGGGRVR